MSVLNNMNDDNDNDDNDNKNNNYREKVVKTIKRAENDIEININSTTSLSSSSSSSYSSSSSSSLSSSFSTSIKNIHNNYHEINNKSNFKSKIKSNPKSKLKLKLQSIFKSSTFLLSLHNSERPDKKRVTIPLNYFENTSFIKSIYQIWKYRLNSSIILCGRWWRIICSHPLGIYFIVFPSITKQIYLNGYEGYRFFWWHKKTVIEKPYII